MPDPVARPDVERLRRICDDALKTVFPGSVYELFDQVLTYLRAVEGERDALMATLRQAQEGLIEAGLAQEQSGPDGGDRRTGQHRADQPTPETVEGEQDGLANTLRYANEHIDRLEGCLGRVIHALDSARRIGDAEDIPEGSRYIQISDTLAREWSRQLAALRGA